MFQTTNQNSILCQKAMIPWSLSHWHFTFFLTAIRKISHSPCSRANSKSRSCPEWSMASAQTRSLPWRKKHWISMIPPSKTCPIMFPCEASGLCQGLLHSRIWRNYSDAVPYTDNDGGFRGTQKYVWNMWVKTPRFCLSQTPFLLMKSPDFAGEIAHIALDENGNHFIHICWLFLAFAIPKCGSNLCIINHYHIYIYIYIIYPPYIYIYIYISLSYIHHSWCLISISSEQSMNSLVKPHSHCRFFTGFPRALGLHTCPWYQVHRRWRSLCPGVGDWVKSHRPWATQWNQSSNALRPCNGNMLLYYR